MPGADTGTMQPEQIKNMVQAGHYKPDPELVAEAMLGRRGMRVLLTSPSPLTPVDRTPQVQQIHPKAA